MDDKPLYLDLELSRLEWKLTLLLDAHKQLKGSVESLKKENEELKQVIRQRETVLDDFQHQDKTSKIVNSMAGAGGSTIELVEIIDEYIIEVDKCIAHLSE